MRVLTSAFITAALALAAIAVDIDIYPASAACGGAFVHCANIAAFTCCSNGGAPIRSARCSNLNPLGPDFCTTALAAGGNLCGSNCNTGGPAPSVCVNTGQCAIGTGALWATRTAKRAVAKCEKTVEPDRAVFANGQSFRINYDVPTNVTALLIELVKTDPHLSEGAPEVVLPYEIKGEKEA